MNFQSYLDLVFPNGLDFYVALDHILNVGVYIAAIGLYAIFIFHFYRFLASRDMFRFDISRYRESRFRALRSFIHFVTYILEYLLVFPIFAFFWFAVLTVILAFLSQERTFADVLLIALATVSAIRVAAYYNEDLSRDLAKILPFAVLGIFIIDASFFTVDDSLAVLREANNHRELIFYYFVFLVLMEFALRIVMGYVMLIITGRRRVFAARAEAVEEAPAAEAVEAGDAEEGEGGPTRGRVQAGNGARRRTGGLDSP